MWLCVCWGGGGGVGVLFYNCLLGICLCVPVFVCFYHWGVGGVGLGEWGPVLFCLSRAYNHMGGWQHGAHNYLCSVMVSGPHPPNTPSDYPLASLPLSLSLSLGCTLYSSHCTFHQLLPSFLLQRQITLLPLLIPAQFKRR